MGTRGFSLGVKRPGREADHLPPSSAKVKEWVELHLHSPNTPSLRGAQLKHKDNFTFIWLHTLSRLNYLNQLKVIIIINFKIGHLGLLRFRNLSSEMYEYVLDIW
jgi:hypothetical protein